VQFAGKVTDYHNRLKIDFSMEGDGSRVNFVLDQCFAGGLAFEEGFFRIEPFGAGLSALVSCKKLQYAPPSEWCSLSALQLRAILVVWLTAATSEYALRMLGAVKASPSGQLDAAVGQLQAGRQSLQRLIGGL
jgi:hypothetical protein